MNKNLGDASPQNPSKGLGEDKFALAKYQLKLLENQITSQGGDEELIALWKELPEELDAGKEKGILDFLEILSFQETESLEAWRKAVYAISNSIKPSIPGSDKQILNSFIQEEFMQTDTSPNKNFEEISLEEKLQTVENKIREFHKQNILLTEKMDESEKEAELTQKQTQLKKAELEYDSLIDTLLLHRRIRNELYFEKYGSKPKT
jgi:hypothetical protein